MGTRESGSIVHLHVIYPCGFAIHFLHNLFEARLIVRLGIGTNGNPELNKNGRRCGKNQSYIIKNTAGLARFYLRSSDSGTGFLLSKLLSANGV